jgi:hypothetical protein
LAQAPEACTHPAVTRGEPAGESPRRRLRHEETVQRAAAEKAPRAKKSRAVPVPESPVNQITAAAMDTMQGRNEKPEASL